MDTKLNLKKIKRFDIIDKLVLIIIASIVFDIIVSNVDSLSIGIKLLIIFILIVLVFAFGGLNVLLIKKIPALRQYFTIKADE